MTFCLICCCKVWREASYDSPYRACGSGSLANSLGGANCILYARSTLASFPDTYQSSKQVVVCRLQTLFYKSTALLFGQQQNAQQVTDKSKEMHRCQRIVAILQVRRFVQRDYCIYVAISIKISVKKKEKSWSINKWLSSMTCVSFSTLL